MTTVEEVSTDSKALIGQMQGILREHLPQQAGELFVKIMTTNDELQAKCVSYEEEIKSLRDLAEDVDVQHNGEITSHEETIKDMSDEMEKLIERVEENKEWKARSERIEKAERELATAILQIKLEEAERRAKDIRDLSAMFAAGKLPT